MSESEETCKIRIITEEVVRQGLERLTKCGVPFAEENVGVYFLLVGLKIGLLDPALAAILEDALVVNRDKVSETMAKESTVRLRKLVELAKEVKDNNVN